MSLLFHFYSSGRLERERNLYQGSVRLSKGRLGEKASHRNHIGSGLLFSWKIPFAHRQSF